MPAIVGNTNHIFRTRVPTGQFGCEKKTIKTYHCEVCGKEKSRVGKVCVVCRGILKTDPNKKEELVCKHCGKTFLAYKSEPNRKYCSMQCFLDNHPKRPTRHNGIHVKCAECGCVLYRRPSEIKKNKTGVWFCDQTCFHRWYIGENHGNFSPNTEPRRGIACLWWKRYVKQRDKECQWCGSKKDLHAHHIIPWRLDEGLRFDVDNGIILCKTCHKRVRRDEMEYARLFNILTVLKGGRWLI